MNRQFLFALMAGTHHHTFADASGRCSICGAVHTPHSYQQGICSVCGFAGCLHPDGLLDDNADTHRCPVCGRLLEHRWQDTPTETLCQTCADCARQKNHVWSNGECTVCGYTCAHAHYSVFTTAQHRCSICRLPAPHQWNMVHEDLRCKQCTVCGEHGNHVFPSATAEQCGTCQYCGDTFSAHEWQSGYCRRCGYACKHSSVTDGVCSICGDRLIKPGAVYFVYSGTYAGSYAADDPVNGQACYRQYVFQDGAWVPGDYTLVVLNITDPTQFGGNYAYTCTGTVFTTSPSTIPVNDTLLSGSGRRNITLTQYNLDGTQKATGSYTSPDCQSLSGRLP